MPVQHAIWRVGLPPSRLPTATLASEQQLEDMIVEDPSILSNEWMLIGRQIVTEFGGRLDLLAVTPDASLVLIELKRDRTPREILAQAIDYACWVEQLDTESIARIYQRFRAEGDLAQDFRQRFGAELDEEALNNSHQIVIVAAELDEATERIVGYLNARDIAINVAFFQVFQDGADQLLSRAWLIDPVETQVHAATAGRGARDREPWNGEFYVSFGPPDYRSWEEAQKYGFISAGGGLWYSQTLHLLEPGSRIWVKIPGTGYVGVGEVTEPVRHMNDFSVETPDGDRPILEVLGRGETYRAQGANDEKAEHFVRVEWLDTVPESEAINEVGLFGNQNSVCRPRTPAWRHTVERLKTRFPDWNLKERPEDSHGHSTARSE